jgi:hypothetical protein
MHEITCSSSSSQVSVFLHCCCYYDYYYCLPKYYSCNCGRFSFVCYAVFFEILHFVGGRDMKGNALVILQSALHSIDRKRLTEEQLLTGYVLLTTLMV